MSAKYSAALVVGLLGLQVSASSTCSPYSAAACPTAFDSCCAFICAEAQVPFAVCQPTDSSGTFAQCTACPSGPASVTTTVASSSASATSIQTSTVTKAPTTLASSASTCSPYSATGCPATSDSCCAFICAEAQVPFAVCQPTDGSGEFAKCTPCNGGHSATSTVPTTSAAPYSAPTGAPIYSNTTTTTTPHSSGATVSPSSNVTGTSLPTAPPSSAGISLSSFLVGAASTAVIGVLCVAFAL